MRAKLGHLLLALGLLLLGAARADEPVRVRVGVHSDHTRVVVDWNDAVTYWTARDGDTWRIMFDRQATLDLSALAKGRPPMLLKATQSTTDAGVMLELLVGPEVGLNHRRLDGRVVLDLVREAKAARAKEPPSKPEPKAAAKAEPKVAPKPEPKDEPKPEPKIAPEPEAEVEVAEIPLPEPKPAPPLPVATPEPVAVAQAEPPPPTPAPAPAPVQVAAPKPVERLVLSVEGTGEMTRLVFPWTEPVGAAAFTRGEQIWFVFDRPARLDLAALAPTRTPSVLRAEQVPIGEGTALRLTLKSVWTPVLLRRQGAWVAGFVPPGAQPATPIAVEPQPSAPGGGRLFLPAGEVGRSYAVTDPDSGDALRVVTVMAAGRGIAAPREFLEFQLLATAQGIVIAPRAEGVTAQAAVGGAEIVAPQGLMLSRAPDPLETKVTTGGTGRGGLFPYDAWRGGTDDYVKGKQALQHVVADAPPERRDAARFALAGFYFAHGLHTDALAILALCGKDDPLLPRRPEFLALGGAAKLLAGRPGEAGTDLRHPSLDGRPEVALWRGLLAQASGDAAQAKREFLFGSGAQDLFPTEARVRFNLGLADAALATGDLKQAETALMQIEADRPNPRAAAEAEFRRGKVLEARGKNDEALGAYDRTVAMEWRPARVRADFARVNLQKTSGRLDDRQYIDRLEGMRFAWRGDALETEMRRRLARAYADAGQHRDALATLRQLIKRAPKDSAIAAALTEDLRRAFVDVYLGPAATKVSPVTALALYEENRDLAPTGVRGDELTRRLADRLVEIDLLDRAAQLLRAHAAQQPPADKARALTRVAVLELLDRKADAALATLQSTESLPADQPLTEERRLLRARALNDLGRAPEALAALDGATDRAAREVRTDLLWRAQRWPDAAAALLDLLGERWKAPDALTDNERRQVLQAAIAYAQAEDAQGAARLKRDWAAKLKDTPEADAFRVLTEQPDVKDVAFRRLASQVAGVGELEAMMTRYRGGKPQGRS